MKNLGINNKIYTACFFGLWVVFLLWLTALTSSSLFTLKLDLNSAYKPIPQIGETALGLTVLGTDSSKIVFNVASFDSFDSKKMKFNPSIAEKLILTSKTQKEIEEVLDQSELEKWETLSVVPIFKYNLSLLNTPTSTNQWFYFLVQNENSSLIEILSGNREYIQQNFQVKNLVKVLSNISISTASASGFSLAVYDENGNFISSASGTLIIEPTFSTKIYIFITLWVFILASLTAIKKTITLSNEVTQYIRKIWKH